MSKHVSSSGDDTSASRRDAVTESFSTQGGTDDGTRASRRARPAAASQKVPRRMSPRIPRQPPCRTRTRMVGAPDHVRRLPRIVLIMPPRTRRPARFAPPSPATPPPTRDWSGHGPHRTLRTLRPSASAALSPTPPRRRAPRLASPGTAVASLWRLPGWRCWLGPSRPAGAPMSFSATTVTPVVVTPSRIPATAGAVPAGKEAPEDRCPAVVPVGAREAPVVRAVREEAPVEPAGPLPTGTRLAAPDQARAASRETPAPPASSSSRTPPRAQTADGATI